MTDSIANARRFGALLQEGTNDLGHWTPTTPTPISAATATIGIRRDARRGDPVVQADPGTFVSSLTTEDWEPDPDVGGLMHVLCDIPGFWAGFTRFDEDPPPVSWTPLQRETFMVLEGSVRIEIAGGSTLELEPGGVASLPAGTDTTWHITAPFREFWVLSGPTVESTRGQTDA